MIILLDTNAVLDVLLDHLEFAESAAKVLALAEDKRCDAYIAATSITTIAYLCTKALGPAESKNLITDLLKVLKVAPVTGATLRLAVSRDGPDFEDDVLAAAAEEIGASYIITRDKAGFPQPPCPVFPPDQFLRMVRLELGGG